MTVVANAVSVSGLIFDQAPWLYDRHRPGYPAAAVDALLELAKLRPGARALEVGAGTGQLTIPLARRGLVITALEPGPRMAAFLAEKLEAYPGVRVVSARFEKANVAPSSFDVVVSATAFHWVDAAVRYRLAARALRPDGTLALVRNDHVLGPSNVDYYRAVSDTYRRRAPELGPPYMPPEESELAGLRTEMAESGQFDVVDERRFSWEQPYTASELVGLLRTYSNHRALRAGTRAALLSDIRTVVETDLGGRFVDRYVTTVCVGRLVA